MNYYRANVFDILGNILEYLHSPLQPYLEMCPSIHAISCVVSFRPEVAQLEQTWQLR